MKMIYGLASIDGGELAVLGREATRERRAIKQRLGVVPQETNLDGELTVRENLTVHARYFGIEPAEAARRAGELLEFSLLDDRGGERVWALSGGMKRRLLVARALINEPELVVLDEPTTGLDPQARHLVWDRLRELTNEGKTLILTTHYMEEAARLCDRLVIMEGGLIIAEGTPGALVEEHVSPQVLEFRTDHRSLEELVPILEAASDAVERTGDESILAYTDDADALLERVRGSGMEIENTVYRQAGLEDVFLRLTGRRLVE
jgi:lipooligosaccharide transport system ATP-binding protein